MIRVLKKREGFTLIELMMVVAVIGILAAVLVPRIGGTKNEAKLAGMETNVRTVQAAVEANIGRYQGNPGNATANPTNFATRIAASSNGIQNPFTPTLINGGTSATIPAAVPTTAVVAITAAGVTAPTATTLVVAGTVIVTCTIDGNNAINQVVISSYDDTGVPLTPVTVNR